MLSLRRELKMKTATSVRLMVLALLLVAATVLYSCGSRANTGGALSSSSAQIVTCPTTASKAVSISGLAFQANSVTISVNDIVKWTNNDSVVHTVTSGVPGSLDGKFDSGNLNPGSTVCVQFLAAGSYAYFCNIHTFMTGLVTVQ
jgi:plastocyanin